MNITKIKRNLAKIGIGNPLNKLFYTSKEIDEKRKLGEIFDPKDSYPIKRKGRPKEYRSDDYKLGYSVGYQVGSRKSQNILALKMDIRLKRACESWVEWNHKKIDGNSFAFMFYGLFKKEIKSINKK